MSPDAGFSCNINSHKHRHILKIATYNVNGVNGRLEVFLRGVEEASPDIVCLRKLKANDKSFMRKNSKGPGSARSGRDENSGTASLFYGKGREPVLTRRRVSGDSDDTHRRYIEAALNGMASGCLYVSKCNPAPGPTFNAGVDKHVWDGSIRATTHLSG